MKINISKKEIKEKEESFKLNQGLCRQVFDNCGISTVRLAINRSLRDPNDMERMNALLSGLAAYIEGIYEEINFEQVLKLGGL